MLGIFSLKSGSLLKRGEYRIERVLGQGGFGITYEAEQVSLGRKVAVKEFFMKDYCDREDGSSHVTLSASSSSRELVERFRTKFVREARMIAGLDHDHIVKIIDVFEENGTAYYVMEYIGGGCLGDGVKAGKAMPEREAVESIRQIASALEYLHNKCIIHFDVKPSNVLQTEDGKLKLIDFGISKHYDEAGVQTSSTPVGISKGYAPLEQYQQGSDIKSFTPATDIYSLGATLFALLTGSNPPEASIVNEDGVPAIEGISPKTMHTIEKAMQPRRKDRPQSVKEFLNLLNGTVRILKEDEETKVTILDSKHESVNKSIEEPHVSPSCSSKLGMNHSLKKSLKLLIALVFISIPVVGIRWLGVSLFVIMGYIFIGLLAVIIRPFSNSQSRDQHRKRLRLFCFLSGIIVLAYVAIFVLSNIDIAWPCGKSKPTGLIDEHEYVDMGLCVKWATMNVGATSQEDYGDYFAWGETSPKDEYNWSTLKYITETNEDKITINKYNSIDHKTILDLSDDAANANWGGCWRMPTKDEFEELMDNCTWTWRKLNGVKGFKVKSKINGNSIFFPVAGAYNADGLYYFGERGRYWSSSLDVSSITEPLFLRFNADGYDCAKHERFRGLSVRPVCP